MPLAGIPFSLSVFADQKPDFVEIGFYLCYLLRSCHPL